MLIVFTPLAFGCVYLWGIALMEWLVLLMALAWVFKLLHTGKLQVVHTPLNWPILLFLGLTGLQLLPLPPIVLYFVSPNTYSLYQQTLAGWPDHEPLPLIPGRAVSRQSIPLQKHGDAVFLSSEDKEQGGESADRRDDSGAASISRWRPLSLYSHATQADFSLALTYAVVFLIAVNNLRSWDQLNRLILTLLSVGGIVAVLGLLQKVSGTEKIYWFWQPIWGGSSFGPYVSRNHFAGYMAMVLPVGLGWLWGQLAQGDQGDRMASWRWREQLAAVLGGRNGWLLPLAFALVNMAAALIFSASRGGIVSFVSSLLFFSLLVSLARGPGHPLKLVAPMLAACVLAYALWLGIDHVMQRFQELKQADARLSYWSATLGLIGEFPLLGTGLGTYVYGFRRHNPVLKPVVVDHAHNDYLELLVEAGLVGFLIVVGGLGWFCWRTLKHWFTRHDPQVRGVVLGGLTSILAIGIHSLVDFNLHIPANALLLSVILGLTSVAVHLRQHQGRAVVVFRVRELRLPRPLRLAIYPLALVLTLALTLCIGKSFAADRQAAIAERMERGARSSVALETVVEQWAQVVALAPDNANYYYYLGWAYDSLMQAQWSSDPVQALVSGIQAMTAYREAILRNPTSPYPYRAWAWALDSEVRLAGRVAENRDAIAISDNIEGKRLSYFIAQLTQHFDSAAKWSQQLMQTATHLDPTVAFAHYSAGLYTLRQWETLESEERTRVVQQLRSAVQLEPKYTTVILQALWERTQDRDLVRAVAHGTPEAAKWRVDDRNAISAR